MCVYLCVHTQVWCKWTGSTVACVGVYGCLDQSNPSYVSDPATPISCNAALLYDVL